MEVNLTSFPNALEEPWNYYPNYSGWPNETEFPCDRITDMHLYEKVVLPILYILVLLVGLTGNGLMLAVLLSSGRGSIRITEVYLMHLALADLLLLCTLPFILISNIHGWIFGSFLCKMHHVFRDLSCHCGSVLLACISFDRYIAIVHAVQHLGNRRPLSVHRICAVVWLVCLAFSLPNTVFHCVEEEIPNSTFLMCGLFGSDGHTSNWLFATRFIAHLCFFLPLVVMTYCYSAVVFTLCQRGTSREKQGAIRLAMIITVIFLFCWLPYNISLLMESLTIWNITELRCENLKLLDKVVVVSESFGYMHSCLNPILYAFLAVKFRRDLLRMLSRSPWLKRHLEADRISSLFTSARGTTTSSSYV
ncbi:C-X-C chemokine receptor type 5 isoform X1 [Brienomyrus brachyistius]|uniref:C-X-C chemokine receptor type 5 isoform X1 n=2 Tax=Brienomyrus brachyistius TaxID=42636 RepID=UPI0020B35A8F|nr:C-X-C chemokine receptor type 5 isoform X1 [Brienomyrus brachyistius]